jgi:FAD/FMN-containing dehydrogenase
MRAAFEGENVKDLLADLEQQISGDVVGPDGSGYARAATAWNSAITQRPAAVVLPAAQTVAPDVAAVMRTAAARGLTVAVQGTGHGATGLVDERTVLVSTAHLRGVEIQGSIAVVQPGAKWSDLVAPAAAHGLAGLAGSSTDVGIVGYSTGGGIGWLGRAFGLACNAIVGAELVTPDGTVHTVSADSDDELFWAIRGGLANFGIVTELRIQLFPVTSVVAGYLTWPAGRAIDVLQEYCTWALGLPDEVTTTAMVVNPPSGPFVYVGLCSLLPQEETAALVAPLLALGKPTQNTVGVMSPAQLGSIHLDPLEPTASVSDARVLHAIAPADIPRLADVLPGPQRPLAMLELRRLGGAIGRSAADHGALDHLAGDFLLFCLGVQGVTGTDAAINHAIDRALGALRAAETGRTALNFVDRPIPARSEFTARAYERLLGIRRRIDPDHRMRASHPI